MRWYELNRWMAYRHIEHPSMRFYTFTFPCCFGVVFTIFLFLLPNGFLMSGTSGFLNAVIGSISLLPGFFVAALAAVSTFGGDHMDEEMPAPSPKLFIRTGQTSGSEDLTRRMFLSYLFGYLAILSLFLTAGCHLLIIVSPSVTPVLSLFLTEPVLPYVLITLKGALVFSILFLLGSLLVTTLHGAYYLMERIFQPN